MKTRSLWRAFGLEAEPAVRVAGAEAASSLAVTLIAEGDAFASALRDCLEGLGMQVMEGAAVRVLAGTQRVLAPQRLVALGDAALLLLGAEGFAVEPIEPRHGELVRCTPADGAGAFIAARYTRWRLAGDRVLPGWEVWATDASGAPQVLVHRERRIACILFRPDSLLSQPAAVELFARAIAMCAG